MGTIPSNTQGSTPQYPSLTAVPNGQVYDPTDPATHYGRTKAELSARQTALEELADEALARTLPPFKLSSLAEILDRPDVPYIIPGWLPEVCIGIIFGAEYTGKSLLAMALAGSVATGVPWLGLTPAVSGPVIYCLGEGQAGLGQRMRAMMRGHLMGVVPQILFLEQPFPLTPYSAQAFCVALADQGIVKPRSIIFDAKMDFYDGAENSNDDGQRLVMSQKIIRDHFETAVIVVDHAGNEAGDRNRGASRFRQAQDIRWMVTQGLVTCQKTKEDRRPDPLPFAIQGVGGTSSATIRPVIEEETEIRQDNRDADAMEVVAANPTMTTRHLLALIRQALGVSQAEANRWLQARVADGSIERVPGNGSSFTYRVT